MTDQVKIWKELLAEDDNWECWGPRYIFKDEYFIKENSNDYQIHIIGYFDPKELRYKFERLYTIQVEDN